ncbi:hypothetical protein PoB_002466100 [Plakobranchus ocellatus]|uniref:Uncharacterized protein n=1 Tax=Plakobranchus ocellatus TaxID=259542 RepID=A0AAV3ZUG3_9GAST|nr:hypothetical protein PoB_002466100 [Plakobranchus ocellatus]
MFYFVKGLEIINEAELEVQKSGVSGGRGGSWIDCGNRVNVGADGGDGSDEGSGDGGGNIGGSGCGNGYSVDCIENGGVSVDDGGNGRSDGVLMMVTIVMVVVLVVMVW